MNKCLHRNAFSLYYFHVIYFINLACCSDFVTDGPIKKYVKKIKYLCILCILCHKLLIYNSVLGNSNVISIKTNLIDIR